MNTITVIWDKEAKQFDATCADGEKRHQLIGSSKRSAPEAVGKLIGSHPENFGIELVFDFPGSPYAE